jgi:hypothetical protein
VMGGAERIAAPDPGPISAFQGILSRRRPVQASFRDRPPQSRCCEGVGVTEDPVYTRWKRQHPKFPGVAKCVELLGRRNVQGSLVDIICRELRENASCHTVELMAAFQAERDERVRRILLGIICEAKLPEALPVFAEHLRSEDESLRYWSEVGLRSLDTHESRKALWEAGPPNRKCNG